jgi:hypothetical protein
VKPSLTEAELLRNKHLHFLFPKKSCKKKNLIVRVFVFNDNLQQKEDVHNKEEKRRIGETEVVLDVFVMMQPEATFVTTKEQEQGQEKHQLCKFTNTIVFKFLE